MNAINRETIQRSVQFLLIEKVNLNITFQPVCLIVKRLKPASPASAETMSLAGSESGVIVNIAS